MSRRERAERLRSLIEGEGDAVGEATRTFNAARGAAVDDLDRYGALRDEARGIKEDAIERLPALVEQVEESVSANGGTVHVAADAREANRIVAARCEAVDAGTVVKSKSMTTEEIGLNDHLSSIGVDVYETDLGEFVLQVADEAPSHLVAPGMHKSRGEIARLLEGAFDPAEPLDSAAALTRFASDYLGDRIEAADVGVTGANFVLCDSGSIVLVTNEGNARKCATAPDVHVAVAGVEKLLPSIDDVGPFLELVARSGTGQEITQYVSILSPPVDTPTLDFRRPAEPVGDAGDREFHLVLLDNGRLDMRADDQLRETLYCIRCGACANACANFQHVGGHAFGGETYTGGIATGWEAGVHGLDSAASFNDLCTGCSRCAPACPVKIDIPWINTVVRDRLHAGGGDGLRDVLAAGLSPDGVTDRGLPHRFFASVDRLARLASRTAPASNRIGELGPVRALLERLVGLDPDRDLPTFRRETLRRWYAGRGPRVPESADEAVLYPDLYTDHVRVDRGRAAVRVLEALGYRVRIPRVPETGRAALSQGYIAAAGDRARTVADALADPVAAGTPIVVIEPSDLAMLRHDYGRLLPGAAHRRLASASVDVLELVADSLAGGTDPGVLAAGDGSSVVYHAHCQARSIGIDAPAVGVMERRGYAVATTDAECCGMAGSFGYKAEFADLSRAVGERLVGELPDGARPVASGASCAAQLESLLDGDVVHPVSLLDPGSG